MKRGHRTAAIMASLTSTCRRPQADPQLDLTQLLMNRTRGRHVISTPGPPTNGSSRR